MIDVLNQYWNKEFDGFEPRAHNLKHEYKSRWVRFHALPESKRYPETEQEYSEVFRRHNLLLSELLGDEKCILIVVPEYSEKKVPTNPEPELQRLFPVTEWWCSLKEHAEDDLYKSYWHLHVAKLVFTGSELNHVFRLVADDLVRNILIISPKLNVVFHPYDGGSDVVLSSEEERSKLRERYSKWLSAHPEGM